MLQSPLLTLANVIIGNKTRFFVSMIVLGAVIAIIPLVVYGINHPDLNLLTLSFENARIMGLQGLIGVILVYGLRGFLEDGRIIVDDATTRPARRRLQSERRSEVS